MIRPGAVGFINWLGLIAWLLDKLIIIRTLAVNRLSSAAWTPLHVATENVQLSLRDAAIVTRLSICSPVVFLLAVANAIKDLAADTECCGDTFRHAAVNLTR